MKPGTHCRRGHAFSGENVRCYQRRNGTVQRYCRTCERLRRQARPHPLRSYQGRMGLLAGTMPTARELEVLQMLARGATQREAAEQLDVSVQTIKNHLTAVYRRFTVRNLAGAICRAVADDLITLSA